MKKKLFLGFIFFTFFTFVVCANEKKVDMKETRDNTISFSKVFTQNGVPNLNLLTAEKTSDGGSNIDYAKLSKVMYWVFFGGVILGCSDIVFLAVVGILVGLRMAKQIDYDKNIGWALLGVSLGILVLAAAIIIVGVVLWKVFEKKAGTASLFMETNRVGVASITDRYTNISNAAIGLKFSF